MMLDSLNEWYPLVNGYEWCGDCIEYCTTLSAPSFVFHSMVKWFYAENKEQIDNNGSLPQSLCIYDVKCLRLKCCLYAFKIIFIAAKSTFAFTYFEYFCCFFFFISNFVENSFLDCN